MAKQLFGILLNSDAQCFENQLNSIKAKETNFMQLKEQISVYDFFIYAFNSSNNAIQAHAKINAIERATPKQRDSTLWKEGRRKRLTASNLGRSKTLQSRINLAITILNDKSLDINFLLLSMAL